MEVFDVLILGAELSMALAGFAGIIATQRRYAGLTWSGLALSWSILFWPHCNVV